MDTNNVTNLNDTAIINTIGFVAEHKISVVQVGSNWRLQATEEVGGLDLSKTFTNKFEAYRYLYDFMKRQNVLNVKAA